MSLSLVDNIFDAYRDPKNKNEDLFYGFREKYIDEPDKADDEFDPLEKTLAGFAAKAGQRVADYTKQSLINSAMRHKGSFEDMQAFLSKKSSITSFNAAMVAGLHGQQLDSLPFYRNLEFNHGGDIKFHDIRPKEGFGKQALEKVLTKHPEKSTSVLDTSIRLISIRDIFTDTTYISFPPLQGDLATEILGGAGYKTKFGTEKFKFNDSNAKVSKNFQMLYEILRNEIIEIMDITDSKNVVLTGHSMGGGLATIASGDDLFKNRNVTVNTFGGPVVGDEKFFKYIKDNHPSIEFNRVVHKNDPFSQIGDFKHYEDLVWDISDPNDDVYKGFKELSLKNFINENGFKEGVKMYLEKFVDSAGYLIDETHRGTGIYNLLTKAVSGDTYQERVPNSFVKKGKFANIAKVIKKFDELTVWDSIKYIKEYISDHGVNFNDFGELVRKNQKFNDVLDITKQIYSRAGFALDGSFKAIKNLNGQKIIKNFDLHFLQKSKHYDDVYKEMTDSVTPKTLEKFNQVLDPNNLDDVIFTFDDVEFKSDFFEREIGTSFMEFDDDGFNKVSKIEVNDILKKQFDNTFTNILDRTDRLFTLSEKNRKIITKTTTILESSDAVKRSKEIAEKITKEVKQVRDVISKSISHKKDLDYYTLYKDPQEKSVKITPLTKRFAKFSDTTKGLMSHKMMKLREDVFPIKGVTGIKKGLAKAKNVSQPIVNSGLDLMKKLIGKASKFGFTSAKMMKIVGKITSKESLPAIGVGLEIGFTAAEIDEDLKRIEDEKAYVVWNGEVIFKLYNPEEYAQISALKIIYNTNDIDKKGVSFDSFLNTWYGRLSTDENGVLLIDGVRSDDPDFDVVYTETVTNIRGEGYTGTESKTLSVIKNVGIGVFNIALDMLDVIPFSVAASTGTAIATGVIDEVFEAQAISKKANGFTRAMKFKILNDSYHNIANEAIKNMYGLVDEKSKHILIDYLNAYISEKYSSTLPDNTPGLTKTSEELRKQLLDLGFSEWVLDSAITDIRDVERLYNIAPDIVKDTALTPVLTAFTPFVAIGGIMDYELNRFKGVLTNLQEMGEQRKKATSVYNDLIEKYWDAYGRERGVKKNGIIQKFDSVDPRRNYVNKAFLEQLLAYKELVDAQVDQIMKLVDEEVINQNEANTLLMTVYEGFEMDLKILDVTTTLNNSAYFNDPGVKDAVHSFRQKSMESTKAKRDLINQTLLPLLQKHGTQEEGRNLELEMKLEIKKAEIRHLLKQAGFPEDHAYGEILLQEFKNRNRDIFPLAEGEIPITVDTEAIARAGLGRARLNRAINDWETLENMQLGNIIRQEYLFITKVIDVYHDPRSIYANEAEIMKFYQDQGIEIDVEKRQEMEQDFNIKRSVMGHLDAVFYSIFSEEGNISSFDEIPEEFDVPQEYRGHIDLIREIIKKAQKSDDKDIKKTVTTELDILYDEGKKSLKVNFKQQDQAQAIQQTDVLNEREQFDLGFADKDDKQSVKFQPTGKILPFTMDNGPPRMLFEDGKEKSYIGPKNALAGGIEQGYWIGVIPNGEHAPVNTLDNFFMAYHIESQEDPNIAKARFIARTKQALSSETISQEKNYTEYQTALYTLAFLERNDHLFGLELTNEFMRNGIGATINTQLREEMTPDLRKGVLPDDINNELLSKMEIEEEIDESNVLKRAADFAKELGDDTMATQFDKISKSSTQMKRIADEYIGNIKKRQRILNNGEKSLPNGMDRLILEKSIETEDIKEKYTKLIVESLGKQLFEFL